MICEVGGEFCKKRPGGSFCRFCEVGEGLRLPFF